MIQPIGQYPKFLKCNKTAESYVWSKDLVRPWKSGELVKVAPMEEQYSSRYVGTSKEDFQQKYVVVYRKGDDGKFSLRYTADWKIFDVINKNDIKK